MKTWSECAQIRLRLTFTGPAGVMFSCEFRKHDKCSKPNTVL